MRVNEEMCYQFDSIRYCSIVPVSYTIHRLSRWVHHPGKGGMVISVKVVP